MRISVLEEGTAAVLGQARTRGSSAMAAREDRLVCSWAGWRLRRTEMSLALVACPNEPLQGIALSCCLYLKN